jgi:hypothetical protein
MIHTLRTNVNSFAFGIALINFRITIMRTQPDTHIIIYEYPIVYLRYPLPSASADG